MMTYDENFVQEQQQRIEDGYRRLGERFYAANRDNAPAEYADVFADIQACEKAIADCEAQQRRAKELEEKGLILCPFCGEEIVDRSVFCNFCGKRLSDYRAEQAAVSEEPAVEAPAAEEPAAEEPVTAQAAPALRVCGQCGFQTDDAGAVFCNNCGARLGEVNAAAPQEKRCPFCGFRTTDADVLFCIECGARMV